MKNNKTFKITGKSLVYFFFLINFPQQKEKRPEIVLFFFKCYFPYGWGENWKRRKS